MILLELSKCQIFLGSLNFELIVMILLKAILKHFFLGKQGKSNFLVEFLCEILNEKDLYFFSDLGFF
jgi:hypothetical protein